jgi:hypothetical protein
MKIMIFLWIVAVPYMSPAKNLGGGAGGAKENFKGGVIKFHHFFAKRNF